MLYSEDLMLLLLLLSPSLILSMMVPCCSFLWIYLLDHRIGDPDGSPSYAGLRNPQALLLTTMDTRYVDNDN